MSAAPLHRFARRCGLWLLYLLTIPVALALVLLSNAHDFLTEGGLIDD